MTRVLSLQALPIYSDDDFFWGLANAFSSAFSVGCVCC